MTLTAQKTVNVLMVEDEPGDAEYLRWMLKDVPGGAFSLDSVDRLSAALDHLRSRHADVVLLDLSLPDSHGIETLTRLRNSQPHIPLVILTGQNDEQMAIEALRHGAQDYLVKGQTDPNLLARSVRYSISRKQVESELRESQEQLRRVQKMEAIGRLAGGIAHDFNNMLTSILGFARFTATQLGDDHPSSGDVNEIVRTGQRAAALTRQLLALTQEQATMELHPIDLNRVIREMHQLLRRTLGEDIEIVTVCGDGLWPVKADAGQMEQVLMNLAVNARDAMPKGGTLTIESGNIALDETLCASRRGLRPGDHVFVRVRDTGCGMSEEVLEKAFDPFYTTKEKGKGTGLGLSTVYGIVTHFLGHVELVSRPGSGTEAILYLPRTRDSASDGPTDNKRAVPGGTETILVVEDEDTIRQLVVRMLKDLGYDVMHARHGGAALEICARYSGTIDLVISDVVMPHVDGPEMLRRLREIRKDFKALYMSGYTEGRLTDSAPEHADTPILAKPFSKEELAGKIREVLDGTREKPET